MVLIEASNFPMHARVWASEVWFSSCFQLFLFLCFNLPYCLLLIHPPSHTPSFLHHIFLWNNLELTNTSWNATWLAHNLIVHNLVLTYLSKNVSNLHNPEFFLVINVRLIHETLQDHFQIQLLNENLLTSRIAGRKMECGKNRAWSRIDGGKGEVRSAVL